MTCSICGREERTEANFCSNCGRMLAQRVSPASWGPYGGQLVRPHEGRMVAGVCAGVALHYGWDLALVRLVVLLSIVFGGVSLVVYLAAWICIPNAPYLLPAGMPVSPQATGTMGR